MSPETLAALVGLDGRPPVEGRCAAWVPPAGRWCDKTPTEGYLCSRHHRVALRRAEGEADRITRRAERRAERRPRLEAELRQVEARILHLDPPHKGPFDSAQYGGKAHPSVTRQRATALADWRVAELADLHKRKARLVTQLGQVDETKEVQA